MTMDDMDFAVAFLLTTLAFGLGAGLLVGAFHGALLGFATFLMTAAGLFQAGLVYLRHRRQG